MILLVMIYFTKYNFILVIVQIQQMQSKSKGIEFGAIWSSKP